MQKSGGKIPEMWMTCGPAEKLHAKVNKDKSQGADESKGGKGPPGALSSPNREKTHERVSTRRGGRRRGSHCTYGSFRHRGTKAPQGRGRNALKIGIGEARPGLP